MMTWEEIQNIKTQLRADKTFKHDKELFRQFVDDHKNTSWENLDVLDDLLLSHAFTNQWPRRKFDTILHDIVQEIKFIDSYSNVVGLLTNILDSVEGGSMKTPKFYKDPDDDDVRRGHAINGTWWRSDFYNDDN